jgi:hypothetical protein
MGMAQPELLLPLEGICRQWNIYRKYIFQNNLNVLIQELRDHINLC